MCTVRTPSLLSQRIAFSSTLSGSEKLRVTKLGHVQRGGTPGVFDRLLATRLGAAAVEHLAGDQHGILVGMIGGRVVPTPLAAVANVTKPLDAALLELAEILAR